MLLNTKQILLLYMCVQHSLQYKGHWSLTDMIQQLKKKMAIRKGFKEKTLWFSVLKDQIPLPLLKVQELVIYILRDMPLIFFDFGGVISRFIDGENIRQK